MAIQTRETSVEQSDAAPIVPLTREAIADLRLGWWSKFGTADIQAIIERHPGWSVWCPSTREYALVDEWRHRPEIAHVVELLAPRQPDAMVEALLQQVERSDANLLLAIEIDESRRPAFYERAGFEMLEEVIVYERDGLHDLPSAGRVTLRWIDPSVVTHLETLISIDHRAFPWLWQNSVKEFRTYALASGVEIHLIEVDGESVGYIGTTAYLGWGHIDRVAIVPEMQGRGYGRAAVVGAMHRLRMLGATKLGLSTQRGNGRSQRVYEGLGFVRQPTGDYRLYGRILRMPEGVSSVTGDPEANANGNGRDR